MPRCEEPEGRAAPYQDEPGTESGSEGGVVIGCVLLGTVLVDTYWAGFSLYPQLNGGQQICFKRRQDGFSCPKFRHHTPSGDVAVV